MPLEINGKKMRKIVLNSVLILGSLFLLTGCFRRVAPEGFGPTDLEQGLIAYDQGEWESAMKYFNNALEYNPDDTEALFKRGIIFQRLNKTDQAIQSYQQVLRVDRKHYKAHYNLGNLFSFEKGDTVQAVFHYRKFLASSPTHRNAREVRKKLADLTNVPGDKGLKHRDSARGKATRPLMPASTGVLVQPPTMTPLPLPLLTKKPIEMPLPQAAQAPLLMPSHFPQVVCLSGTVGEKQVEGSGFVIGRRGYLLASAHQVERTTRLMARFQDGSSHPATLLSVSEALDLALLQIPLQNVMPLVLDAKPSPPVGEAVVAVGCPFGLSHSATQGIISAPERKLGGKPLLQTDVAINPGSSGGPLMNAKGDVVGIIVGALPEAKGIAFALTSRKARHFLGETFLQIGTLFADAKRYDEAAEALSMSSEFWPNSPRTFNNLGEVFRRTKQFEKAKTAYVRAVSLDPQYADAHYNLGILYDNHLRDRSQAANHYRQYLDLDPDSPDALQVGQWLSAAEAAK